MKEPITNTDIEAITAILMPLKLDKETHNQLASEIVGVFYNKIEALQEIVIGLLRVKASHTVFTGGKEIEMIAGEWRELEEKHGELLNGLNE